MTKHPMRRFVFWLLLCMSLSGAGAAIADSGVFGSVGQTVYVPVYSHIYSGDRERPVYLATTLSIRNVDPGSAITITAVDYYDSEGNLLQSYLEAPLRLGKLATVRYVVKQSDKKGGSGANFLVRWQSDQAVSPPLIESIMIGAQNQLGISFTSRGRVIEEEKAAGRK